MNGPIRLKLLVKINCMKRRQQLKKWILQTNIPIDQITACLEDTGVYAESLCYWLVAQGSGWLVAGIELLGSGRYSVCLPATSAAQQCEQGCLLHLRAPIPFREVDPARKPGPPELHGRSGRRCVRGQAGDPAVVTAFPHMPPAPCRARNTTGAHKKCAAPLEAHGASP